MNQSAPNPGSRWTKPVARRLSSGAASEGGAVTTYTEGAPTSGIFVSGPAS